ncbi:HI0933 family protein [Desulfurispirillum indicum S5]|uniref:HI0933 family protein n=1 Tax=Desulfurispirillum indicum (strain ATCC BAA-1389 / DSM 22839 / S5) TaxID=653733 RepID=E6W360_DESIS|nr:NAD(P)/FAD-dependent oxidoreductase [Desulfurispirillum indicum]ADU65721.1 HI0933 family protein [Desulfurispirillum indicum S5]
MQNFDVVILGAGASGLMCAAQAGKRGRRVVVLDHNTQAGRKVLVSGGGRCNFTNAQLSAGHYLSHNPHFVKSALSRFNQWDFLSLISEYGIKWHEREHGQYFCDESAAQVVDMLLAECRRSSATVMLGTTIHSVERLEDGAFSLHTSRGGYRCRSLVVATGGLSIPPLGASPLGYRIAEQFGLTVRRPSAGLVPLTLQPQDKQRLAPLSGIAVEATVQVEGISFRENVLFTHRGLSGPAILQISNYWQPGQAVTIDWLPSASVDEVIGEAREQQPKQQVKTVLTRLLPARMVAALLPVELLDTQLAQLSRKQVELVFRQLHHWQVTPNGTEGYRTAEVTRGGVDCDGISSKTMECKTVPGLYFVGEVLDVTGWLGGYNLQWAWSSGWCAGQFA